MIPKQLQTLQEVPIKSEYDAISVLKRLEDMPEQIITLYPLPLFIMSPRIKLYEAKKIKKFKGHLHKFHLDECEESHIPEATITLTVLEEVR